MGINIPLVQQPIVLNVYVQDPHAHQTALSTCFFTFKSSMFLCLLFSVSINMLSCFAAAFSFQLLELPCYVLYVADTTTRNFFVFYEASYSLGVTVF